ncbi:sporulation protein YqfD [Peribacillus muralis]|uniref:sporulation protein YqfD n=1 Tax=Peribacillus muralis TaxID=264697 RepID=UPI00070AF0C6|nr:sporulation protein YqfD [Peribacillus muralis]MCK1991553.1 sporulation protein YqfD [Peribacillus muralis]MCK2012112.1 sporulation protein YqfD [Peribacillus muralis]
MKNQWTNYYTGYVKVKARGKGAERLINMLTRRGLHIWDVKRVGSETLIFHMDFRDIPKLRQVMRKSDCKVKFMQGKGVPFLMKRVMNNSGFLVGLIAFLLCIFVLSNMVWGIEVKDAKPATEHAIRKELDKMGVKIGKVQFFVDDVDTIQRKLSDRIGALTWVGVELKGTTYHFRVVEKRQPKEIEKTSPQNLVASKKAIIAHMFVEKGQSKVNVNDYVGKGQLLVSGLIGKEDKQEIVSAQGVIKGKTWYNAEVKIPMKTKFSVLNGNETNKHYLKMGDFSLPVWGFGDPGYNKQEKETTIRPFHFLQWELPISYKQVTLRSKEDIVRSYTREEAVKEGRKMAKAELNKHLDEEDEIVEEKILHESMENGKVKLSIHYQVIEDIAIGQPIIQGD